MVEFLNPSIKDFITGELIASPERLSDLIQSSLRFEQLVTLWRWSLQAKGTSCRTVISGENDKFLSAIEAAIARPYRLVTVIEKGSAERRVDIYPEERLAALLGMTDDLQSQRLLALVPSVVNSVLERWKETVPDFEETTGILCHMEEESWSKALLDPALYESLRAQMFANLRHAYSFIDFMHVESFLNETKIAATGMEHEAVSTGFGSYISSQFSQDLYETSSSSEALEDMADFFSRMIRKHGHDISEQYGRVMEMITERNEREERHADEYRGAWQGERNFETADEESISSMFDSLR